MPAYTHLRDFVAALKTGRTHITDCLDAFFSDLDEARRDPNYADFIGGNWSSGPPPWLGGFLDRIGLKPEERDHVLRWPPSELEKARAAAAAVVTGTPPASPHFRWEIYHGSDEITQPSPAPSPVILFRSPGSNLRLTRFNYGEIYP